MTAPAPTSQDLPEIGQVGTSDRRDRRIYVWWAVALGLLLLVGSFCWLVAGPFLRARAAVNETCCYVQGHEEWDGFIDAEIQNLGGPREAAKGLWLYYVAPETIARNKGAVHWMLERCGPDAVPYFERLLNHPNPDVRAAAAAALKKIRTEELRK